MKFLKGVFDFICSPGFFALVAIIMIIGEELTGRTMRGQIYILVLFFAYLLARIAQLLEQVVENVRH